MTNTQYRLVEIVAQYGPKSAYSLHKIADATNVRDSRGNKLTDASVRSRCAELRALNIFTEVGREPTGRGGHTAAVWGLK